MLSYAQVMVAPALEVRHLRLLAALDEVGSLQAAARRLHLTASALSLQLREVEDRLGGKLFDRRWRQLRITPAGKHLTKLAHDLLAEISRAEHEARALMGGAKGTVRFTTACSQSSGWLPRLFNAWRTSRPGLELVLVPEAAENPAEWLDTRRLDAAVVPTQHTRLTKLRLEPLFRDELLAVVGRGHPWFRRRSIDAAAFGTEHYWGPTDAYHPDTPLGRAFDQARVAPAMVTAVPIGSGVPVEMARMNLGVTVVPRSLVDDALGSSLAGVRIGREGLWLDWHVATRDEPSDAPLSAFLTELKRLHPQA